VLTNESIYAGPSVKPMAKYKGLDCSRLIQEYPAKLQTLQQVDEALMKRIALLSNSNPDYWAFPSGAAPRDAHAFFRYPAMMVPSMQRELLKIITELQPNIGSVLEPFAGSGTVMVESILAGLSVRAQDVNPLAILLCKAKSGPFYPCKLEKHAAQISALIQLDKGRTIDVEFENRAKWFTTKVSVGLSKIRRAILQIPDCASRRFFWVALAETVRRTSNSRTSTYKLHIRTDESISQISDVLHVYDNISRANLERYTNYVDQLRNAGRLKNYQCNVKIDIRIADSRDSIKGLYDLLITSPPYGDNKTTVPYGQSAYLPLQWIPFSDIAKNADRHCINTTAEIDRRSLGGVLLQRGELYAHYAHLLERSMALRRTINQLRDQPRDRTSRVLAFVQDLDMSMSACTAALKNNAYSFVTLGNRCVGGIEIPLHEILPELMEMRGSRLVHTVIRRIPSKRMAVRNQFTATMRNERVIIFRKHSDNTKTSSLCSGKI